MVEEHRHDLYLVIGCRANCSSLLANPRGSSMTIFGMVLKNISITMADLRETFAAVWVEKLASFKANPLLVYGMCLGTAILSYPYRV